MHIRRIALPAAAAVAGLALTAAPASAHVTVTPNTTAANSYAVLTFALGHGCEGSPTTAIEIAMPEEIPSVAPTQHPLWDVKKVMEKLDEPIEDSHGNRITERVAQVVYTAKTPLPDGYRDAFELSVQLPDAAGETLAFPTVQKCVKGETGWVETPAEGQDAEELERPAPVVTVTEAEGDGHGDTVTDDEGAETSSDAGTTEAGAGADTEAASAGDEGGNGLAIAGLVAGLAGVVAGCVALARSGRRA